jgi:hypothetical protein
MSDKVNKFKVGDEVEIVSLMETIERFGGEDSILPIGSISVVNEVYDGEDELTLEDGFSYDPDDLKLIKSADEINTSQNESINKGIESKPYNPLVAQEGGGHYKNRGIQPLEYTMKNNLSFCEGNVVKYISRYKSKNGIEDLAKVIHYALLASYEEYGEQGSTELKQKVLKLLGEHG